MGKTIYEFLGSNISIISILYFKVSLSKLDVEDDNKYIVSISSSNRIYCYLISVRLCFYF